MIDAAWVGDDVAGDTGSSNYTTVAWVTGVGKGLTVTPANGDTGKRLFIPNAGIRQNAGNAFEYGTTLRFWSATQRNATDAWRILFYYYDDQASSQIAANYKLWAVSLSIYLYRS